MADQDKIWLIAQGRLNDFGQAHRPEFGVDEPYLMTGIDQRAAQRQEAERRQVIVGNVAAYGGVRRIDQNDFHGGPPVGPRMLAGDVDARLARFSS